MIQFVEGVDNILVNGDCLKVMKEIQDKSVDLILCDLPYGTTACKWDSIIPFDKLWEQYSRVIRPNGFIVLTASQPFTTKLINSNIDGFSHQWIWQKEQGSNPLLANVMPMKNFEDVIVFYNEYKKYDYELVSPLRYYFNNILFHLGKTTKDIEKDLGHRRAEHVFYVKPKIVNGELKYGSTQFELCTKKTYEEVLEFYDIKEEDWILSYEELLVFDKLFEESLPDYPRIYNPQKTIGKQYKSGGGYIEHLDNYVEGGKISNERFPTSIIKFNTDKSKSQHPTQKPVALMEYLIKTYTNKGMVVLDNTMGSGSTGVACVNTGRKFIGIELDEKYFNIATKRVNGLSSFDTDSTTKSNTITGEKK